MGSDRCMAETIKEIRCDVCGLEIEDGEGILVTGQLDVHLNPDVTPYFLSFQERPL